MKHTMITVMKKELARFFGDKRLAFTTLLMPALMIYGMYTFMGTAMSDMFNASEEPARVLTQNLPESLRPMFEEIFELAAADDPESAKEQVIDKDAELLMIFPENFEAAVLNPGDTVPAVQLYYHSATTDSSHAYQTAAALLDGFESSLANRFDVNPGGEGFDLASDAETTGTMMSMLLPMLLMTFLFSGCMSVAPESIAGEKERGTIAALLVTPAQRSGIALGKIMALSLIALLSGVSSAAGTILSIPKLMSGADELMDVSVYGMADYLPLAAVILSTVLPLVTMISLISCFAKTVKEASGYLSPLMILVMLLGITSMFGGVQTGLYWYCIPLYNSVQCISGIFSFTQVPGAVPVTVISNLVFTGLGVWLLTRMFNSEKVMFSR